MTETLKRLPILALLVATGCASIFHGASQKIEVWSDPPGATASSGGESITTPGSLVLSRKAETADVKIEKIGYTPKTVRLSRKTSGGVWWNAGWVLAGVALGAAATQSSVLSGSNGSSGDAILLGGIGIGGVGSVIDFKSGAAYRLEPAKLVIKLEPEQPALVQVRDTPKEAVSTRR